jgi:WhiB family redox-sensing transcriptional regulator
MAAGSSSQMSRDGRCPFSRRDRREADASILPNCPFQIDCLAEALDNRIEWGVWGGASERERRSILRRQPDVTPWKAELSVPMAR